MQPQDELAARFEKMLDMPAYLSSRGFVAAAVALDPAPAAFADGTRLPVTRRTGGWWLDQFEGASQRHPAVRWHLSLQGTSRLGRSVVRLHQGGRPLRKPPLDAPEDISIYELHVRDFSANDPTVPAGERGTFRAFTHPWSNGMRHLATLAFAGLSHVHLLPSFDFVTIDEDKTSGSLRAISRGCRRTPTSSRRRSAPSPVSTGSTGATTPGTTPCRREATRPIPTGRRGYWSSARWSRRWAASGSAR